MHGSNITLVVSFRMKSLQPGVRSSGLQDFRSRAVRVDGWDFKVSGQGPKIQTSKEGDCWIGVQLPSTGMIPITDILILP